MKDKLFLVLFLIAFVLLFFVPAQYGNKLSIISLVLFIASWPLIMIFSYWKWTLLIDIILIVLMMSIVLIPGGYLKQLLFDNPLIFIFFNGFDTPIEVAFEDEVITLRSTQIIKREYYGKNHSLLITDPATGTKRTQKFSNGAVFLSYGSEFQLTIQEVIYMPSGSGYPRTSRRNRPTVTKVKKEVLTMAGSFRVYLSSRDVPKTRSRSRHKYLAVSYEMINN